MTKGHQATVATPGNNEKRYLSGSIHWRTGQVFITEGRPKQGRDTALFLAHLDDLRSRLRRYTKIHVICDNAGCHTSEAVAIYLWEHRDRIDLHFTQRIADCNPIERVWWHLHDQVTRNHRCQSMQELLDLTFALAEGTQSVQHRGRLPLPDRYVAHFPRCGELFSETRDLVPTFTGGPGSPNAFVVFNEPVLRVPCSEDGFLAVS